MLIMGKRLFSKLHVKRTQFNMFYQGYLKTCFFHNELQINAHDEPWMSPPNSFNPDYFQFEGLIIQMYMYILHIIYCLVRGPVDVLIWYLCTLYLTFFNLVFRFLLFWENFSCKRLGKKTCRIEFVIY